MKASIFRAKNALNFFIFLANACTACTTFKAIIVCNETLSDFNVLDTISGQKTQQTFIQAENNVKLESEKEVNILQCGEVRENYRNLCNCKYRTRLYNSLPAVHVVTFAHLPAIIHPCLYERVYFWHEYITM